MGETPVQFQPPAFCSVDPAVDIQCEFGFMLEYAHTHYPLVPYHQLLTGSEELDDVHSEIDVRKRRYNEVGVGLNAFVTQAPIESQPTTKHGIDWTRPIELNVPTAVAVELGLATVNSTGYLASILFAMGDKFIYGFDENTNPMTFEVLNVKMGDRIMNTEIPAYIKLEAQVFRKDSAEEVDFDLDPE